jgi:hypothetical protein
MAQPRIAPSEEEKRRIIHLAKTRECPHCGNSISLADAISMVQGFGVEQWEQIELRMAGWYRYCAAKSIHSR